MTRTAIYTPSIWGAAALIAFTAMMGFADALLVASAPDVHRQGWRRDR